MLRRTRRPDAKGGREPVRGASGSVHEIPFSASPTDVYTNRSIHVHFDKNDVIEGIEISRPNVFLCFGRNVLGEIAREIAEWIRLEDSSFAEDALGYSISNGRLVLYVPEKGDHPDAMIKTVYISYEDGRV